VGAGSVVRHDVPPNSIVAGNPARIVRYIFQKAGESTMTNVSGSAGGGGDRILLLDLVTPHRELENGLHAVLSTALATASFVGSLRKQSSGVSSMPLYMPLRAASSQKQLQEEGRHLHLGIIHFRDTHPR
jgi:hypothetical protein